jgi:hypothetical protein
MIFAQAGQGIIAIKILFTGMSTWENRCGYLAAMVKIMRNFGAEPALHQARNRQ